MTYPNTIKRLFKEIIIFSVILILLALLLHPDLLSSPLERIERMIATKNYMHALSFTAVVYAVAGAFRLVIGLIIYFKNKKQR